MDPWQIIGAAVVIVCGLVGVIYWAGQTRDDKQDARFDKDEAKLDTHIRDDIEAHERLKAVETKVENLQIEVRSLREMRHEIIEQCSRSISDFYTDSVKRIADLREWIVDRLK
jgi:predicted transcriptional regulator